MPGMGRFLFTAVIVGLFVYVASPMLLPVAMGAVLAVLFNPWMRALQQMRFARRRLGAPASAGALTAGITILVLVPSVLLLVSGIKSGIIQLRALQKMQTSAEYAGYGSFLESFVDTPAMQRLLDFLHTFFSVESEEFLSGVQEMVRGFGLKLADFLALLVGQLPSAGLAFVVVVLSTFFFLLDGRRLTNYLREHSFFEKDQTERLIDSFGTMCRSVFLATVVSGAAQTAIFTSAAAFAGTPNLALVALLVFLFSFVPLVGSTPATFAVVIYHGLMGHGTTAISLGVIALFVTVLDNFIRPWVLKGAGNLHPLLAFVAAFGGIQMLGITGVFIGPIVAGMFVVTIRILLERNSSTLNKTH